jgi:hypothetical protein
MKFPLSREKQNVESKFLSWRIKQNANEVPLVQSKQNVNKLFELLGIVSKLPIQV